jgi:serine/threonine protein kinase
LIEGADLNEKLSKPRVIKPHNAINLITHLAPGIQEAHWAGLIHRDIKPSNVILRGGRWDQPVLVDFGCVHVEDATRLTSSISHMGTMSFMAPEVRRNARSISRAADQWSLGRLAAEVIAVALGNRYQEIRQLRIEELITEYIDEELPSVAEVLSQAASEDPNRRYESAEQFAICLFQSAVEDGWIEDHESVKRTTTRQAKEDSEDIADYFRGLGFECEDRRPVKGALWILSNSKALEQYREFCKARGYKLQFTERGGSASGYVLLQLKCDTTRSTLWSNGGCVLLQLKCDTTRSTLWSNGGCHESLKGSCPALASGLYA